MQILGKPVKEIGPDDIHSLVDNEVKESISIEYKECLPRNNDREKKEFLRDVSAFANRIGGTIVYGIKEKRDADGKPTGTPSEIVGVGDINPDQEILRLESILRSSVSPRLANTVLRALGVQDKTVLLIGIQRSVSGPHMITYQRSCPFWVRTNGGKSEMDVSELRSAFLQSEECEKVADNFRTSRINHVLDGSFLPNLKTECAYFIHIVPLGANRDPINAELANEKIEGLTRNTSGQWKRRYNIDGPGRTLGEARVSAYVQCFRNGAVEFFTTTPREAGESDSQPIRCLNGQRIEEYAVRYLSNYFTFAQALSIGPPIVLYLSLTGVKGSYIFMNQEWIRNLDPGFEAFDRDRVLLPGLSIEDFGFEAGHILKPAFDMLWQAGGWEKSPFQNG